MKKICATVFILTAAAFPVSMIEAIEDNHAERNKDIEPFVNECISATNADPYEVDLWMRNKTYLPIPSPCFKCFLKCTSEKAGFAKADGTLDVDFVTKHFGGVLTIDQIIVCVKLQDLNLDECDKTYQLSMCVDKTIQENISKPVKPIAE
ncbi:general odorant-binding protein 57c-like [Photinus pyralis]|uniref:general odorant-binding protein 57c-like n=1 Tax=Photinus pyralis TaxID=7054 RepID=UPI001266E685|nr:general odorant-binding protein 57c-like [Photinus pyralis]